MMDFVYVGITEVDGHPAWSVKLILDYAAHPGEKDFNRSYTIVPLGLLASAALRKEQRRAGEGEEASRGFGDRGRCKLKTCGMNGDFI